MTTTAHRLAPTVVRQLVSAAVAAPSVHNTQPWLFAVSGDRIRLRADVSRQLLAQDPEGRALAISCGAALLNLRLAARHLGFADRTTVLPEPSDASTIAEVELHEGNPSTGMSEELFAAIPHRHTNRMPYEDRPVPPAVLDALAEAAEQEDAHFYSVTEPGERRRLVELIHDADATQDSDVLAEIKQWTGVEPSRNDGVPEKSLGPLPHNAGTPHRDLGAGRVIGGRGFAVFEQDPTLGVLTTDRDDQASWVTAGQALQRLLLVLTVEGLVATFANQPIESPHLRWLVRDPDQSIGFPQMLLRIGYAPAAAATPRRPIEDVILSQ